MSNQETSPSLREAEKSLGFILGRPDDDKVTMPISEFKRLLEAHSLQERKDAELHWMRNTSQVLQFVIDADSGFQGDSKAWAQHWKINTDKLISDRIKELEDGTAR